MFNQKDKLGCFIKIMNELSFSNATFTVYK